MCGNPLLLECVDQRAKRSSKQDTRLYTACHIRQEAPALAAARLKLADETRIVLKNGLKLIGVEAPERM